MAWIESHQDIEKHPKTLNLAALMGWDIDQAIGKLHRFWWWCLNYAEDGDLRRYNDTTLAAVVGVASIDAKRFVEAMVGCGGEAASGFIDRSPYFRVHDWWDYAGMLLQIRYKHDPKKWQKIRALYVGKRKNCSKGGSKNSTPTNLNQPTLTNQPKEPMDVAIPIDLESNRPEILEWLVFKKEKNQGYKPKGLVALWTALRKIPVGQRKECIEHSMASNYAGIYEKKGALHGNRSHIAGAATPSGTGERIID